MGSGFGTGTFTFSRTGSTAAALTANITVSGTATSGSDYTALGTTVNFAAGSATATKTVTVLDDALAESDETVIITVAAGTGYTVGTPSSATVTIKDDDKVVTVTASDAVAMMVACARKLAGAGQNIFAYLITGGSEMFSEAWAMFSSPATINEDASPSICARSYWRAS